MTTQAPSELLPNEVAEVERHKYFLSESAGYDVGWEHAEADWLAHHAIEFRQEQVLRADEQDVLPVDQQEVVPVDQQCELPVNTNDEHPVEEACPSSTAPRTGKIGTFFGRLLSKSRAK